MKRPKIGIGIILENELGQILIGKRIGGHAPFYSIPGGHLEQGESFEEAAKREMLEETGVEIFEPVVCSVSNNLLTFAKEGIHSVSINVLAKKFEGEIKNLEPHKCEGWFWVDAKALPMPHFEASENAVQCYLKNSFYNQKENEDGN